VEYQCLKANGEYTKCAGELGEYHIMMKPDQSYKLRGRVQSAQRWKDGLVMRLKTRNRTAGLVVKFPCPLPAKRGARGCPLAPSTCKKPCYVVIRLLRIPQNLFGDEAFKFLGATVRFSSIEEGPTTGLEP
jgi:hypothetical protein